MTWKDLATFALTVPPDFAATDVAVYYDPRDGLPPDPMMVVSVNLDDRGPSLTVASRGGE